MRDGEDARAVVVLGDVLGQVERPDTPGAAVETQRGAAHGGPQAQQRRQAEVRARGSRAGVGAEDDVRDVRGWAAPLCDGIGSSARGELGDFRCRHLDSGFKRRLFSVVEIWMGAEYFLVDVEEAFLYT